MRPEDGLNSWLRGIALSFLDRHEEALQTLRAQAADSDRVTQITLAIFTTRVALGEIAEAKQGWKSLLKPTETTIEEERQEILLTALKEITEQGHFELSRELIAESNLEEAFFPFARALDYAMSGDRALIEKLPLELRSVVEEIVAALPSRDDKKTADTQEPKASKRRRQSLSQSRKRLS